MRLLTATFMIFSSCSGSADEKIIVEYKDGRQLLTVNEKTINGEKLNVPEIGHLADDSVQVGEQYYIRIFLRTREYKLVAAYKDLDTTSNNSVDTAIVSSEYYKPLRGTRLVVENDTVHIYFTPGATGQRRFDNITILTMDRDKIFRTQTYGVPYKVYDK